ncbi:MAG: hypothetical protein M3Q66_02955 [Chloroflexota bacterium]|nr:hypothetical protein [Chloroflexota bacterium]
MTDIQTRDPVALACHARYVPAIDREQFVRRLREASGALVILETGHRVEAYGIGLDDAVRDVFAL